MRRVHCYVTVLVLKSSCHDDQLADCGHCALTSGKTNQYPATSSLVFKDHERNQVMSNLSFGLLPPGSARPNQAES